MFGVQEMFPAAAAESAGSSTPISHLNPNRQSPRSDRSTPTSRSRGTDNDTCYCCRKKGHWASSCPQKSNNKSSPSLPTKINGQDVPVQEKQCRCGAGICHVRISGTVKNPHRKFYCCPRSGTTTSCEFFQWCDTDTVTIKGNPNGVQLKPSNPPCACGAGESILLTERDGRNVGRKYFACPVKKGQGACNFKQWQDDLPGKGSEEGVERALKFSDTVTLSHHNEQRASLSSGPSNGEILDVVDSGAHVGEQPESVGQGAGSDLQCLDHPGKDFHSNEVTRALIFSDTGVHSQYDEQRKSLSPGPFEGEIIDREASDDLFAVQSDLEVSNQSLHQFCEQIESNNSLLFREPSEGEVHDTDASGVLTSVQSGSEGGNSFAGPEGAEGYMSDILLSTARHFANEFLKRIQGHGVPFFLRQRSQLVEAIRWVTSFGVDCSFFVSQIDDLIQLIDDFQALSFLAEKEAAIQQSEGQLTSLDSEDASQQASLNTIEGELQSMAQAEGALVAEQAENLQAFNTVNEKLRRLASERQLLQEKKARLEAAAAESQQFKAELEEKIRQNRQDKADIIATLQTGYRSAEQLRDHLRISLSSLQMWD